MRVLAYDVSRVFRGREGESSKEEARKHSVN